MVEEQKSHHWVQGKDKGMKPSQLLYDVWMCKHCGILKRADDKNKPCRGPVKVTLR
jgi:rubrerythrin